MIINRDDLTVFTRHVNILMERIHHKEDMDNADDKSAGVWVIEVFAVPHCQQFTSFPTFDSSCFTDHENPMEQLEETEGRRLLLI